MLQLAVLILTDPECPPVCDRDSFCSSSASGPQLLKHHNKMQSMKLTVAAPLHHHHHLSVSSSSHPSFMFSFLTLTPCIFAVPLVSQ